MGAESTDYQEPDECDDVTRTQDEERSVRGAYSAELRCGITLFGGPWETDEDE